jgi:vacuolar-type H+-ATPase subunit D/Vma8
MLRTYLKISTSRRRISLLQEIRKTISVRRDALVLDVQACELERMDLGSNFERARVRERRECAVALRVVSKTA